MLHKIAIWSWKLLFYVLSDLKITNIRENLKRDQYRTSEHFSSRAENRLAFLSPFFLGKERKWTP